MIAISIICRDSSLGTLLIVTVFVLFYICNRKKNKQPSVSALTENMETRGIVPFPLTLTQPRQFWNQGYRLGSFEREKRHDGVHSIIPRIGRRKEGREPLQNGSSVPTATLPIYEMYPDAPPGYSCPYQ